LELFLSHQERIIITIIIIIIIEFQKYVVGKSSFVFLWCEYSIFTTF